MFGVYLNVRCLNHCLYSGRTTLQSGSPRTRTRDRLPRRGDFVLRNVVAACEAPQHYALCRPVQQASRCQNVKKYRCDPFSTRGLWIVWWSFCSNRVRPMAEASKRFGCGRWNYWMGARCRTTVQFLSCRWFDPSVCRVGLALNQTPYRIRLRSNRRYRGLW